MKIFKRGFTLSELLIVLAIIGIVAIVTIPVLIKNINKQKIGPMLGKSVEQIELGCQNMIQTANNNRTDGSYGDMLSAFTVKDLDPENPSSNSLATAPLSIGATFMGLESGGSSIIKIKTYDGNSFNLAPHIPIAGGTPGSSSANVYRFTKFPATVYTGYILNAGPSEPYDIVQDPIIIDVNGTSEPNTIGKDMFMFKLQNNGKMVPYGLPASGDSYLDNCSDNNITDGKACAARVIADGYKVTYNLK